MYSIKILKMVEMWNIILEKGGEQMQLIEREEYLDWLKRWQDKQIIKVVSGVRRCGKSTLFSLFKAELVKQHVSAEQIISINFEAIEFEQLRDYRALYQYIIEHLQTGKMNYIFLDEVQHCKEYQKAVDSLFIKDNCDVYLTGSNAYFMSGELATVLSGRYVELKMLPLSFKEFTTALEGKYAMLTTEQKFNLYLEFGSFPFITRYNSFNEDAQSYLQDVYNTIILNDVVKRLNVADVTALDNVVRFMVYSIGNKISVNKIANTLKSVGKGVDVKTIDKYLAGLTDALLLYKAPRYNIKGRQLLTTLGKYYVVDIGLRNLLVRTKESDIGHILENIVYLELKRRGYEVYVGDIDNGEVDFVAIKAGLVEYYQVSATTLEESTLKRELAPFKAIRDNYPKYLLTLDTLFSNYDYAGVRKINVLDWLLK